jgi:RNA polymerase sigma-70 factor (ECF subfamily)
VRAADRRCFDRAVCAGEVSRVYRTGSGKGQRTENFEAFFRAEFSTVARSLGLVVGDREEGVELAQEAFARAWSRWNRYGTIEHARNSVMRIGINLARSEARRRRRLTDQTSTEARSPEVDVPTQLAIVEALRTLSERQRTCVVLTDYMGMDSRQAARLLRIPAGSVRTHVARGRKRLRTLLDEQNQEMNR